MYPSPFGSTYIPVLHSGHRSSNGNTLEHWNVRLHMYEVIVSNADGKSWKDFVLIKLSTILYFVSSQQWSTTILLFPIWFTWTAVGIQIRVQVQSHRDFVPPGSHWNHSNLAPPTPPHPAGWRGVTPHGRNKWRRAAARSRQWAWRDTNRH